MTLDVAPFWIGGGLALAGTALGVFGTLVTGLLERRSQRQKHLRERYEEMTDCIAALQPWLARLSGAHTLEDVQENRPPDHHRRMLILSLIYFPEFKKPIVDYYNATIDRYHLACECSVADSNLSIGSRMALKMKSEGKKDAIFDCMNILYDLVIKNSSKYTKA